MTRHQERAEFDVGQDFFVITGSVTSYRLSQNTFTKMFCFIQMPKKIPGRD